MANRGVSLTGGAVRVTSATGTSETPSGTNASAGIATQARAANAASVSAPPPSGNFPAGDAEAYVWVGGIDTSYLANPANSIDASDLVAHGFTGIVISGTGNWWVEDPYHADIGANVSAGLKVCIGHYIASGPPIDSTANINAHVANVTSLWAQAADAGATGCGGDCEPYTDTGQWYSISTSAAYDYGAALGTVAMDHDFDEWIMYLSSGASWTGSYNDLVQINAGNGSGLYDGNRLSYFIDGVCSVTPSGFMTITDAVFHSGPQLAGYTWDTGSAYTVELINDKFPEVRGSVMPWPDIDEGSWAPPNDGYDPGALTVAATAAHDNSTGPWVMYQHELTRGTDLTRWNAWLDEVQAVMT